MKLILSTAAFGAALALAATAPIAAQDTGGSMKHMPHMGGMAMMKAPLKVALKELNGSGESGTAILRDTKAGLVVMLTLTGSKGIQPAHIHKGSCAKLDPKPWYPLKNVINGKSTTTVPGVTIGEIIGKSAINVHKSLKDLPTYVACGDVAK
ncbi:MAG TPA: hypothetical protein VK669_06790 [Candidatus Limnocylindrales bacterium]|nr:hypothetical protein [Candidatus Limnocylindrales bacterium]